MKILLFIATLFVSNLLFGQNPYDRLKGEFRTLVDQIPIDKGQEEYFFKYATELYKKDSLRKAAQIFDRLYWLDKGSKIGYQSLLMRKQIEEKVIKLTQDNLNRGWIWSWSGSNWGQSDSPSESKSTKRIELNGEIIKFYRNDTLIRQTKYTLTQTFGWINGSSINQIKYEDNKEDWYFSLTSIEDFTSDKLWIERKSNSVCGNYGECYLLDKPKQLLTKVL